MPGVPLSTMTYLYRAEYVKESNKGGKQGTGKEIVGTISLCSIEKNNHRGLKFYLKVEENRFLTIRATIGMQFGMKIDVAMSAGQTGSELSKASGIIYN